MFRLLLLLVTVLSLLLAGCQAANGPGTTSQAEATPVIEPGGVSPLPTPTLVIISPLPTPTVELVEPAQAATPQPYFNQEGGFSLALPAGWTVSEPRQTPLGTQLLLGPAPLAEDDPANSLIYIANVQDMFLEKAVEQLCEGSCNPMPEITELTLGGRPAWQADIQGDSAVPLTWHFVDNGDKFIFFSLHDPQTLEPATDIINSLSFQPVIDAAAHGEEAAQLASQVLRQQLGANFDDITVLGVEQVEWPDSCLGAPQPNERCARMLTPGYVVSLEANGQQYDYHVSQNLSELRLASAPTPDPGETLLAWEQAGKTCETLIIGGKGAAFGPCGGPLTSGRLIEEMGRPQEWELFVQTYAPFEAETPAGKVSFQGQGSQAATPAEQRMIAEWARLVNLEVQSGRSGASWGLVLAWHREGGIAGFCEDVTVYVTGMATVTSCQGNNPQELGPVRLTAEELEQIYTWVDTLRNFEVEQKDPAVADAMTVRLLFTGSGSQPATPADQQAMLDLAETLLNRAEGQ